VVTVFSGVLAFRGYFNFGDQPISSPCPLSGSKTL
jgi:hypothetical protein